MFRSELPRIYELRDLVSDPSLPGVYFQNLDQSLLEIPQKLRQFREIERQLQGLDSDAWIFLKSELKPLLSSTDEKRGWEPVFNTLNQAKAYNHLKRAGYETVKFIPRSPVRGQKTPDLKALSDNGAALCEVKTINCSDAEAERRYSAGVITVSSKLDSGFFNKLLSCIELADAQITAYDPNPAIKKIVFVIINFDDSLHEYADQYGKQIEQFWLGHAKSELEAVFNWAPAFFIART